MTTVNPSNRGGVPHGSDNATAKGNRVVGGIPNAGRMNIFAADPIENGRWERRGHIWHFIPDDPAEFAEQRKAEPETLDPRTWSEERTRKHHAAWIRGERDFRTEVGHREWMRRYKARKRAEARSQQKGQAA